MKTDYITPESAADQNPTEKNGERLTEKKQPTQTPNPGKNEGHNYDKPSPEENDELSDVDPNAKLNATLATTAGGGEKETSPQPEPEKTNQEQYEQETGPATAPEKTREAPKAD